MTMLLHVFIWVGTLLSSRYGFFLSEDYTTNSFFLSFYLGCNTCHCLPPKSIQLKLVWEIIWLQLSRDRSAVHVLLTSAGWVHSNVYGLYLIQCIRYLTAVEPFLSTSSAKQNYHHLTSGSVEIPLGTWTGNSSSIGKEPVPYGRTHFTSIRRSATSSLESDAEQGIISTFTNVLQGHNTVVLVCYISEYCNWEGMSYKN